LKQQKGGKDGYITVGYNTKYKVKEETYAQGCTKEDGHAANGRQLVIRDGVFYFA
jgi:hypothetical protein